MAKRDRVEMNSGVEKNSSPAWAMPFIDVMRLQNCIAKVEIQLEIPGLCPADGLKTSLSRNAKPKTKRKSSMPHRQNLVIDPRQLQLPFAEA
ncbi:hypothetical protein [Massilia sp. Root335]|uniref:hypothetical protein n=1 Tax=Massilia sp. Root335 TaxID=1736517 RepID=UPI0012F63CC5|nr:hypothetical protein [Massilia sp. Root335]